MRVCVYVGRGGWVATYASVYGEESISVSFRFPSVLLPLSFRYMCE